MVERLSVASPVARAEGSAELVAAASAAARGSYVPLMPSSSARWVVCVGWCVGWCVGGALAVRWRCVGGGGWYVVFGTFVVVRTISS